jgi:hypothetical protein
MNADPRLQTASHTASDQSACCDTVLLSTCCGQESKPTCCGPRAAPVVCGCNGKHADSRSRDADHADNAD